MICLTNLWDVGNVGGGQGGGHSGHYGNGPWTPKESKISELLRPELRGVHPEWWEIGRHIDVSARLAHSCSAVDSLSSRSSHPPSGMSHSTLYTARLKLTTSLPLSRSICAEATSS